ncbi:MAG TPA: DUF952 domain-containing protein [Kofleriaceae bacterium]|nr:DUF952 domain-containing protein [Kofleriaceae bacterium]
MTGALFHLLSQQAWAIARELGRYIPASLATEGFIHLSTADQWPRTLARFYRDTPDLVLLQLDPARLADVRYEPADGELFPHLYAPLDVTAVVGVFEIPRGADGANDPAPVLAQLTAAGSRSP